MMTQSGKLITPVTVIAVSQALEGTTGELTYQVTFGMNVEVGEELERNIPRNPLGVPIRVVGENVLILFFKFDGPVPYRVGDEWRLAVDRDGGLTLSQEKPV